MSDTLLFNIQKFSIHDGAGIRTTVFFKGCPLSCLWCHNPESQSPRQELMLYPDRCVHCGACAAICPVGAISEEIITDRSRCTVCGRCTDVCMADARTIIGYTMDVNKLVEAVTADTAFYEVSGGGITLSGGEPLMQDPAFLKALCQRLKRRGYSIDIDTGGAVSYDRMEQLLPYVDTFLYDIKHMDPEMHKALTGISNTQILKNLTRLSADGARIHLRLPLMKGINDNDEEIEAVIRFAKPLKIQAVSLLPYHKTGSDKSTRLGKEQHLFETPSEEHLASIRDRFLAAGFHQVKIGG